MSSSIRTRRGARPHATTRGLALASFKLRYADVHVRIVPACDENGCAFAGAGVDLRGDDARAVFALASPLVDWLRAREPVTVRAIAVDLARRRVLVSIEPERGGARPRVIRIDEASDASSTTELFALASPLVDRLGELARDTIARRVPQPGT